MNGKFAAALLAAQKEMPAVQPDSVNPHFKSKFVSLGHLIAKVRPVLNKHGLAFTQYPARAEDGKPTLVTILMHESGEQMRTEAELLLPKQDPQGQGSAITYMRRYALASALGISDQEDDDGNGAGAPPEPDRVSDGVVTSIVAAVKEKGISWDEQKTMLAAAKVAAPDEKPKSLAAAKAVYAKLTPEGAEAVLEFIADAPDAK